MNSPYIDYQSTRWSLIERLKNADDAASWQDFFDIYWKLIYRAALKWGCTPSEAEEVVQETVISVSKQMPTFHADPSKGSFKAWLRSLTRRRVIDQLRKRSKFVFLPVFSEGWENGSECAGDPGEELVAHNDAEEYWDSEWESQILEVALERVKAKVDPKQFQIFHMSAVKSVAAGEVARQLGVNIAQVYLAKHRVMTKLKREIESCERPSR